eukprot:24841-Prymnesium_polylepis.1
MLQVSSFCLPSDSCRSRREIGGLPWKLCACECAAFSSVTPSCLYHYVNLTLKRDARPKGRPSRRRDAASVQ